MKRLLCDQGFEETIADVEIMSSDELTNHLTKIEFSDSEIQPKLELLGVANTKIDYEIKKLINQQQPFNFKRIAEALKHGKYLLTTLATLKNEKLYRR